MMPPHQPSAARPRNAGQGVGGWEKGRIPTLNLKKKNKEEEYEKKKAGKAIRILGNGMGDTERRPGLLQGFGCSGGGHPPGTLPFLGLSGTGVPHSAPPQLLGESQSLPLMFQTGFYWCKLGVWPAGWKWRRPPQKDGGHPKNLCVTPKTGGSPQKISGRAKKLGDAQKCSGCPKSLWVPQKSSGHLRARGCSEGGGRG